MTDRERELVRQAWEAGFSLCRAYGDNWFHFDGAQKERQFAKLLKELDAPLPIGWMLLDADNVIVGATMGADPGFLCPIPSDCRLRVFHQPVQIGAIFSGAGEPR